MWSPDGRGERGEWGTGVDALSALADDGLIHIRTDITEAGKRYRHEPCCRHCHPVTTGSLDEQAEAVVEAVLDDYLALDTPALVRAVTELPEVTACDKYTPVPFDV